MGVEQEQGANPGARRCRVCASVTVWMSMLSGPMITAALGNGLGEGDHLPRPAKSW